jgi:hypothetical protein
MRAKVSGADQPLLKVLECCEGGTPDLWSWSGVEGNGWLDGVKEASGLHSRAWPAVTMHALGRAGGMLS